MIENETYTVQTSVGKFRVEKTPTHLKVGQWLQARARNFCVEIRFNDEAELQWLITKDGGCELDDKPIRGSSTLHLLHLSFTLLRTYIHVKTIKLLDNSKFDCSLPNGKKTTIFMNTYSYLFHGGTWYDINTNAVPMDPIQHQLYEETKPLYMDPSVYRDTYVKAPFDFKNPGLQEELTPLYEKVTTWKEFADSLHENYGKDELCRKIAPWYQSAVAILTKNRMLPAYWKIDIESSPQIPFTRIAMGGSRRRTQKQRRYRLPSEDYSILSPSDLYSARL